MDDNAAIVDVHVHHRWTARNGRPTAALERSRQLARLSGIKRVLLLGAVTSYPLDPSPEQVYEANIYTKKLMDEDPEFYMGACYINPCHEPSLVTHEITRCLCSGMVAIKLWAAAKASDLRLDPVMQVAAEFGVPVFIHAWHKTTGNSPCESSSSDIAHLARRFPYVPIVMAHLTGVHQRGVLEVADLPNVLVDTSGGQPESGIVEYAVRYLGPQRVLYGSDAPGRHFGTQIGRVLGAQLDAFTKEQILVHNAAALLRIA